jgi:hypothetical protein
MARWLQKTVQGMLNSELSDASMSVTDAAFQKAGDARDFWTERAVSHDEEVALTWHDIGEPLRPIRCRRTRNDLAPLQFRLDMNREMMHVGVASGYA